jgi:hypothetical protein
MVTPKIIGLLSGMKNFDDAKFLGVQNQLIPTKK